MNWMKVKVILIILFLFINIMLVGVLVTKNYNAEPDRAGISEDVYDILTANDISIDKSLIDAEAGYAGIADAYPVSSVESAFMKNIASNGEMTEDGKLMFNGSVIEVFDNLVHFDSVNGRYTQAKAYFESVGIDFSGAHLVSSEGNDSEGSAVYCEKYDGHEIFGTKATVKKSGGVIVSADVVWYEITEPRSGNSRTISYADALLDFAADKGRGNKPCTVVDISRGFSVDAGAETASVSQMIPCIRVTTAIGSSFYYDARSPE